MPNIQTCELPADTLLDKYRRDRAYTDCYVIDVPGPVSHAEYVVAFYTTPVFKLERWLLAWFLGRSSTDAQARDLALGQLDTFAAWSVEARRADQLLMCDFRGSTRSWLRTTPAAGGQSTRLYFGSAVVPVVNRHTGKAKMGFAFRALLGFHKVYSRVLLRAAVRRLARREAASC